MRRADPRVERRLARLAADRARGASALAREAASILALAARGGASERALRALGDRLVAARPAMVPLRYAVGWTLRAGPKGVEAAAGEYAAESARRAEAAAACAARALRRKRTILTHSLSATVLAVFARLDPARARVVVTEARPRREGARAAERLAAMGFRVDLIVDAAAAVFLDEADAVLVGADAALRDGSVVNKVGTRALAALAREARVPFYAVAETFKIDPRPPRAAAGEEMAPSEVLRRPPPGVRARNPYFDRAEARCVTALFTDAGALKPEAVFAVARGQRRLFWN